MAEVVKLLRSHFPYIKFSVGELREVEARGGCILTIENWDRLAGYLILDPRIGNDEPIAQHKNSLYITYMGVRNSCRRMGIGRTLVTGALKSAEAQGKPIYTYVASFNIKELNLLTSMGFKALKEHNKEEHRERGQKHVWIELKYELD